MTARTRRTYRRYSVPGLGCWGSTLLLPVAGWVYLGKPLAYGGAGEAWGRAAGLGGMIFASLMVIPALFVTIACFAPDIPKMAVPRSWRALYRNRTGRCGVKIARNGQKSSYITDRLRQLILAADRYTCVYCRSPAKHIDHRVPWAWGGLTILFNCFSLCGNCNIRKLDYWEQRGRPRYSRHFSPANQMLASAIFRREGRVRWNPFRMLRLAWALGI